MGAPPTAILMLPRPALSKPSMTVFIYVIVVVNSALLPMIRTDTLIVFGDRDPLYPASIACELHAEIRGSHLWVVPNGGHGPIFGDRAPLFASSALSFLRGDWKLQG